MSDRKTVHWFNPQGQHNSAEVCGEFTFDYTALDWNGKPLSKSASPKQIQETYFYSVLSDWGLAEFIDTARDHNWSGKILVLTGNSIVSEDWTADTKEVAFRKFIMRTADANGIDMEKGV